VSFRFTINTLVAKTLNGRKTREFPTHFPRFSLPEASFPARHFITRALLAAENYDQAIEIIKDCGVGAADGCSINLTFLNDFDERKFHNIEMGPALPGTNESQLDITTVGSGESSLHCNNYLRLKIEECVDPYMDATKERFRTLKKFSEPKSLKGVIEMLGDQSHPEHWIFRDKPGPVNKTICVGIFDLKKKTWSLYKDNPKTNDPMVVLPMDFKKN
jgi:hypothetical protein